MMTPEEFELWQQYHRDDEAAQKLEMWRQVAGCIGAQEDAEVRALQHAAEAEIRKFQEHFPDIVRGLRSVQLQHEENEEFRKSFPTDGDFLRACGIAPIE